VVGTGASAGPAQVAGGLVLDTGLVVAGKRIKGRLFISPLGNTQANAVIVPAGTITALTAMGTALIGATPPLTNPMVIWTRPKLGAVGSERTVLTAVGAAKYFSIRSRRD